MRGARLLPLQMFTLCSAQGGLDELEDPIRRSVDDYPGYPVLRCALAGLYCELHREAECAAVLRDLAADDFAALPRDEEWLFGMTLPASVCEFLGDEPRAARVYELLVPFGDRNALSVRMSPPSASSSSVAHRRSCWPTGWAASRAASSPVW